MPKRTFQTDEQAYDAVFNIFLEHSRSENRFPKVHYVENTLGIHMNNYGIVPREIKAKAIKQRLCEIFSQNPNASEKEIEKSLGVDIYQYMKDLGSSGIPELRASSIGKKTTRRFDTKKEALSAFKSKVKETVEKGEYNGRKKIEKIFGLSVRTYDIRWKEEVLYPLCDELIRGELGKNPSLTDDEVMQKYPFARFFLEEQGGLMTFRGNTLLRTLILQTVKPKPEPPTTEEDIWEFARKKTGKYFNTFAIPREIEYLKRTNKIEGDRLHGGYWSVEQA